jgi:hypothetical protein
MAFINSRTLFANKERIEQLVTVLKTLEWSYPTPELALSDGACPSCFAGKPMKFSIIDGIEETFNSKNHMVHCELAKALKMDNIISLEEYSNSLHEEDKFETEGD